jgi:hypothetical protein
MYLIVPTDCTIIRLDKSLGRRFLSYTVIILSLIGIAALSSANAVVLSIHDLRHPSL